MFKVLFRAIEMAKDFFQGIYYAELNHIDNFYRQYR